MKKFLYVFLVILGMHAYVKTASNPSTKSSNAPAPKTFKSCLKNSSYSPIHNLLGNGPHPDNVLHLFMQGQPNSSTTVVVRPEKEHSNFLTTLLVLDLYIIQTQTQKQKLKGWMQNIVTPSPDSDFETFAQTFMSNFPRHPFHALQRFSPELYGTWQKRLDRFNRTKTPKQKVLRLDRFNRTKTPEQKVLRLDRFNKTKIPEQKVLVYGCVLQNVPAIQARLEQALQTKPTSSQTTHDLPAQFFTKPWNQACTPENLHRFVAAQNKQPSPRRTHESRRYVTFLEIEDSAQL